jgi:ribosomal protein L17
MTEDSCVKPADLESLRELMDHRIDALAEKVEIHVAGLKESIETNKREAESNHQHIEQLIALAKEEGAKAREKIDIDLRTLREGRSTDKGRMLGQEPWLKLMMGLLALILGAALLAYLAGRGSNTPAPTPTTNGAHR